MAPTFLTEFDPRYGEAVDVAPGIRRVVANNPSKFTFHGTGTYIISAGAEATSGPAAIIDAGPRLDDHISSVLDAVAGNTVSHLLVTHTHGDHSPSTAGVKVATGATTFGFGPHPAEAVDESEAAQQNQDAEEDTRTPEEIELHRPDTDFVPDVAIGHGDLIEGDGFTFEAIATPGHISNHLCFAHRESNSIFTGDHVMGWSTTIIPPPDGDMGHYLDSLRLLLDRPENTYYPTHGAPITDPKPFVEELLAHRLQREQQILALLEEAGQSIPDMVAIMYAEVDEKLHKPAAKSVEAHLVYLERNKRVRKEQPGSADESDPVFFLN